jgi:hypothetical protein
MWRHKKLVLSVFIGAMLVFCWPVPEAVVAQGKANVPKPQNTLALGEDAVRHLLLLMQPDQNGKISKEEWMKFMAQEFDRLDKDGNGELDAQELRRSSGLVKHARAQDVGK